MALDEPQESDVTYTEHGVTFAIACGLRGVGSGAGVSAYLESCKKRWMWIFLQLLNCPGANLPAVMWTVSDARLARYLPERRADGGGDRE
jgi:hypothetical protein